MMMSKYSSVKSNDNVVISIDQYIGLVRYGAEQDLVLNARAEKQKGNLEKYKFLKSQAKVVTGSAVMKDGARKVNNIKEMNGCIVIDIDGQINENLKTDKYTLIYHLSFGGEGCCIFVKINPDKFEDSFNGLAEYYFDNYNITIDQSCKDKARSRFISFDPDLIHNVKSTKFIAKDVKKYSAPKDVNFIYTQSDFDSILEQIKGKRVNLTNDEYHKYIRIGLALYDKFGISGEQHFHFICSFSPKYNEIQCAKDFKGLSKNSNGSCKIGTFYYYCKQNDISIYSEKTKVIINRTKISKNQGNPDVNQIAKTIKTVNDIDCDAEDIELIQHLIESKIDYSFEANEGTTEIELLTNFVIDTYQPKIDLITNITYILNKVVLSDTEVNDIYLTAKKNFDFNVSINDIRSILNSNLVTKFNALTDFLNDNKSNPTGIINQYINCIHPRSEYNEWAFTKWLIGALHNWTCDNNEKLVCPLTIVLSGQTQGTGKTSFLRNILPKELEQYFVEAKISGSDKDSIYSLCNSLIVFDDEFGGKAFKDVKEYKAISDVNTVTQRRPYERTSKTFKRRAILCGTTNEKDILKDVTGNRRILPIKVDSIDYDRMLQIDKTAMIIEAYNMLMRGDIWILRTEEEINYLKENTSENETVLPIEEIFFNHFSLTHTSFFCVEKVLNQGEILEYLNMNSILKPTKYDLKEVLVKNKLEYKNYRAGDYIKKGIKLYAKIDNNTHLN